MKQNKTKVLLVLAIIMPILAIVQFYSAVTSHNKALKTLEKNETLISTQLGEKIIEAKAYDSIRLKLESETGTQYLNLMNYLKNQGATISDEKARAIPESALNAYSFTASLNNCSIDNLYKIIYYAEQELGMPRFRVAGIELQTQSSGISSSSSTPTPISAKIIFETIVKR